MSTVSLLSPLDDRILKKVGLRMKNLLSLNEESRYYEPPSEGMFASEADAAASGTEDDDEEGGDDNEENLASLGRPFVFTGPAPSREAWQDIPKPFYLSREFVDPLDPKYSAGSILRNVRKRRAWLSKGQDHGPQSKGDS